MECGGDIPFGAAAVIPDIYYRTENSDPGPVVDRLLTAYGIALLRYTS